MKRATITLPTTRHRAAREIVGWALDVPGLGAYKLSEGTRSHWVLCHLASGRKITNGATRKEVAAKAERLADVADWTLPAAELANESTAKRTFAALTDRAFV